MMSKQEFPSGSGGGGGLSPKISPRWAHGTCLRARKLLSIASPGWPAAPRFSHDE
jgi:hypothetical protein